MKVRSLKPVAYRFSGTVIVKASAGCIIIMLGVILGVLVMI